MKRDGLQTWQIYHAAHKVLGPELSKLYTRSARLVAYWAADPRFTDIQHRNPIDRIGDMLVQLDLRGAGDIARGAVDLLAQRLGGRFTETEPSRSDKGTVDGEAADIAIAAGRLIDNLREALADNALDAAERIRVKELARVCQREIDQLLDAAGVHGRD